MSSRDNIQYLPDLTSNKTRVSHRCEQGSNLRGETPLDFKSNALTTRPSQLVFARFSYKISADLISFVGVHYNGHGVDMS